MNIMNSKNKNSQSQRNTYEATKVEPKKQGIFNDPYLHWIPLKSTKEDIRWHKAEYPLTGRVMAAIFGWIVVMIFTYFLSGTKMPLHLIMLESFRTWTKWEIEKAPDLSKILFESNEPSGKVDQSY